MSDLVIIKGLQIRARHGVFEEEKLNEQLFILDLTLQLPLEAACRSDALEDTVNYAEICAAVQGVMQSNCCNLIERAAQLICDELFKSYPTIEAIELTLKKPEAAMPFVLEYPAVRIRRERNGSI